MDKDALDFKLLRDGAKGTAIRYYLPEYHPGTGSLRFDACKLLLRNGRVKSNISRSARYDYKAINPNSFVVELPQTAKSLFEKNQIPIPQNIIFSTNG
jgi:hypothetical protein